MTLKELFKKMMGADHYLVIIPEVNGSVQVISPTRVDSDKITRMLEDIIEQRKGR